MSAMDTYTAAAREALVREVHAFGGWITQGAVDNISARAALMPDLVREGYFEWLPRVPSVHVARYALTDAGTRWAEELS